MKPKDLKSPFRWEQRRVIIVDGVWFVPDYLDDYSSFQFPGWSDPQVFGNDNPVHVEYCSGNGSWIFAKAKQSPHINWVAVEWQFERVRKIWSKTKNAGLKNLFIISGEALTATRHYIPSRSVQHSYINFPDPWPKRRHAKHRLLAPAFVGELSRILAPAGTFTLVTDDPDTSTLGIEEMGANPSFKSEYPDPFFVTQYEGYGTSFFEKLWRDKGRTIHYHRWLCRQPS